MRTKNKKPVSVLLFWKNFSFLENETKNKKITKTQIINDSLDLYRKYKLKKEIQKGFQNQDKKDIDLAMSDFDDYCSIINS